MPVQRIDVEQAKAALDKEDGLYLDVRTEEEFADGHPQGALNIPIGTPNPAAGRIDPNPDFAAVASKVLPKDVPIIVGCRSGPRAEMAARALAHQGFEDIRWVFGGFLGMKDPMGNVVAPGWRELEYPEARGPGGGGAFAALKKKAGR